MSEIRWELYPLVATSPRPRDWLAEQIPLLLCQPLF